MMWIRNLWERILVFGSILSLSESLEMRVADMLTVRRVISNTLSDRTVAIDGRFIERACIVTCGGNNLIFLRADDSRIC